MAPSAEFGSAMATALDGGKEKLPITHMNTTLREELLAPYYLKEDGVGGVRYFEGLPLNVLEKLVKHKLVEMEPWNSCAGVAELFLPFLRRNPSFTAHGYAVSPERKDCRITIEGVEREAPFSKAELVDFALTFAGADELVIDDDPDCNYLRCWYD
jgi:hypothetical protein